MSHWIDDTVDKGQLALSHEGSLDALYRRLTSYWNPKTLWFGTRLKNLTHIVAILKC